jgi:kynurenine formamidase
VEASTASKSTGPTGGEHLLHRRLQVVDLTHEIYMGMPIWENHQKPFIFKNHEREDAPRLFGTPPWEAHNLLLSEHTGTHADAIYEYDADGPALDEIRLEYYYGDACCLDISHVRYPDYFTVEVLEEANAKAGDLIREGDIVLLYTGHGDRTYPNPEYLTEYAGLDRGGAEWLADRGVVNIAVDQVSIDHFDDLGITGHIVCRERQIVNTESLCNLDQLVGKRFTYVGLPLNIDDGTGSPIRAIAILNA